MSSPTASNDTHSISAGQASTCHSVESIAGSPPQPTAASAGRPHLFRQEALDARSSHRPGAVMLAQPVGNDIAAGVAAIIIASICCFAWFGTYTRKATVSGVLSPSDGVLRIVAPASGLVTEVLVKEGQLVAAGDVLFKISGERISSSGATQKLIGEQLAKRQALLVRNARLAEERHAERLRGSDDRLNAIDNELGQLAAEADLLNGREQIGQAHVHRQEESVRSGFISQAAMDTLRSVERLSPTLQFQNVSFRYGEGEPWILRDVSFYVEQGQAVVIVGRSGCGKSTLLKLALGLLQPTEGEVRIGGLPLKQLVLEGVRKLCGTVMQDDHLLAGSLFDNISGFEASPSREAVEDAARLACVAADISRMPMGFQTVVSDMGGSLSGGQKQRVLLARALYRKPRILALDEATSHLDLHVERHLIDAITALPLTRLVIAHRSETIAGVDRIILLAAGRIERNVSTADLAGQTKEASERRQA